MIGKAWSTTPAFAAEVLGGRAAVGAGAVVATPSVAVPAPEYGTRVPSLRLRVPTGGMPFGAGTAADERHLDFDIQNTTTPLGIHSPGRPLG